ncbi:hypothetical protein ATCC90586_002369 [Pythium insidiosum]|nr:hypothetical protein ATCC90586_002369 [Pythium insidiosum]
MSRLAVAISHVELTEAEHTLYVIKVQQDAEDWEVRRTYSDFRRLRDDVHRVLRDDRRHIVDDPCSREFARATHELPFPSKRLFGNKKDHVVKERAVELHRFLIKLLLLTHTYRKAQKALYDASSTNHTERLTAQTITIEAQKELEHHMSEYNAIMVLRYVDRFISKAVTKAPGCYVIQDKRIIIDSARFVEELEEVFADLPSSFSAAFKNDAGEWIFPKALDSYAQMKWNSFQGKDISRSGTYMSRASDSDESDSEYEVQGNGGGYMRKKERAFTEDETDVLQKMIAQGTAGTDQMLRLRRQFDERGWHRHRLPGNEGHQHKFYSMESSELEEFSDTDDDDGSGGEASSVRRFQQQQNAMRKSRLSRREDIGGLV